MAEVLRSSLSARLEILESRPQIESPLPPVLFVHGAYAAAWPWAEHFLPHFAARGFPAYAVSLRAHGGSYGREGLAWTSIADYVDDLAETIIAGAQSALMALAEAISAPGAMDRTIQAPFGEIDGETFARFVVLDGLVHGCDLATATGQSYEPPAEVVDAAMAFAQQAVDTLRDGQTFKDVTEVPDGATPIEGLAAYTGRTVPASTR